MTTPMGLGARLPLHVARYAYGSILFGILVLSSYWLTGSRCSDLTIKSRCS
jgi:hypothetical protein